MFIFTIFLLEFEFRLNKLLFNFITNNFLLFRDKLF
jgi:hypothetical protein